MPTDDDNKIRITSEELASPSVDARLEEMDRARRVALVREVGSPTKAGGTGTAIITLTLGGAAGAAIAFGVQRLLFNVLNLASDNVFITNVGFTFILALFIGIGVSMADVIGNKTWTKVGTVAAVAIPAAVGAGLIFGIIAHFAYTAGTEWIFSTADELVYTGEITTDQQFEDYVLLRLHPIRGLAWLFVGIAAGIAAGAASRSWKRLGLATAGGAIGGFLGGFVFDFFQIGDGSGDASEIIAQLVGIILVGSLIGLATALVEQAGKSRWIEIVRGGLAGKQFILYKPTITLGSSPQADITLIKDSSIPPIAAQISVRGTQSFLSSAIPVGIEPRQRDESLVTINGQPVTQSAVSDMDIIAIGGTELRFRERSQRTKLPRNLA